MDPGMFHPAGESFPDIPSPFDAMPLASAPQFASGPQFVYPPQSSALPDFPFDPSLDILPPGDMSDLPSLAFAHNPADMHQFNTFMAPPGTAPMAQAVDPSLLPPRDPSNSSSTDMAKLPSGDSSGSLPRRGGGRRSTRTAEEKQAAMQEKNRRAQKRFRERQREKMLTMEDSVAKLAEQVQQLSTENNNLAARNTVLEKVLSLREEQIQTYQQHQKVYDYGSTTPEYVAAKGVAATTKSLACGVPLEVANGQDPIKAIQSKPVEEVTAQWKGYVKEMANLLIEYEHASEDGARQDLHTRICKLIGSAGQLCMLTAMFSPVHIKKMLAATASNEERHLQTIGDPVGFWKPLMDSLELTKEQAAEVTKLRAMFVTRADRLLEERRTIADNMRQATHATLEGNELRSATRDVVRLHELTTSLHTNLRDEHIAGMDFVATLFRKVLPPLPLARVLVHSYPLYPDAYALATCIAQHHGLLEVSPSQLLITAS